MRAFSFAASALTIGFLATAAPAGTWTGPWTGFDAAETERTCKHYGNRARFRHEGAKVAFEAMLADSCYT
ncbi:MAG: hypothetical protein KJN60_03960, partial [Boseongicola sp.]|nr:hypothetical protein [Boseongicola sp.]